MYNGKALRLLDQSRSMIAQEVRALRRERRWTQAELANALGLSQSRFSEIERGDGSFTAEQLLRVLQLFNVPLSRFAAESGDRASEIQNALARLGAQHLEESTDTVPVRDLEDPADVVRAAIVEGSPRVITALAPVLVTNADRVSLKRVHLALRDVGLERRLAWVVGNTLEAIRRELAQPLPKAWAQRCRRAAVVLSAFLEPITAARKVRLPEPVIPDVLDTTIRSKKSLEDVSAVTSPLAREWDIVTRLQPDDFAQALRAARGAD
jgi:transcriptional regulator with XRE-family HTH domain